MAKRKKIMMPKGSMAQKAEWSGSRGSYLTKIPDLERESLEEMDVIPIREPFTYARVVYDHDRSEYVYEVWEPQLDDREKELLEMLKDSLGRTLEYEGDKIGRASCRERG